MKTLGIIVTMGLIILPIQARAQQAQAQAQAEPTEQQLEQRIQQLEGQAQFINQQVANSLRALKEIGRQIGQLQIRLQELQQPEPPKQEPNLEEPEYE